MWLLPALSAVSTFACRIFYRFQLAGPQPSGEGPLILVANHQNSLFDPAFVAAAAERPVRFLAKSTLFHDRRVGWLVKASGAIPVFRAHEVEDAAEKNVVMFESVFSCLAAGDAVGIFPEGGSHSEPSLIPLKTGAARMALGFSSQNDEPLRLVPVGLLLRDKGVFRSGALALRGEPVEWGDLAGRGVEDRAAVDELTRRIEAALREVTVNLERWEDRLLVETVEAVWTASRAPSSDRVARVRRSQRVAEGLSILRRNEGEYWKGLADRVLTHERRLKRLGLRPADLTVKTDLVSSIRWAVRRIHMLLPLAAAYALLGYVLFLPPYWITDLLIRLVDPEEDRSSTYKALLAVPVYLSWILAVSSSAWWLGGLWSGLIALVSLPVVGASALFVRERLQRSWDDLRLFFRLKSRRRWVERLQADQLELASELDELNARISAGEIGR